MQSNVFHANHAIKIGNYGSIVITSPDRYILSALHHFCKVKYFLSGRVMVCFSSRKFQNILPHLWSRQWFRFGLSLSSTSNLCPHQMWYCQQSWYKKQSCQGWIWLLPLTVRIWQGCISWWNDIAWWNITKHYIDTFDELHFIVYHEKYLEFHNECFLPTSDNIRQHILCAYLQRYLWLHSVFFLENIDLDPLEYCYRLTENSMPVPIKSTKPSIPSNFPEPYNCQKCSKASVCKCRLLEICCCQFCKCDASPQCKNPVKWR